MIQERPSWLSRPWVIAGVAFVLGAIVTGVIVAIVLSGGNDDDTGPGVVVTPNASTTPVTPGEPTAGTTTPVATGTPGDPRDPDDALANYVQQELHQTYIGACPQTPPKQVANTICSVELYRSDQLATFNIGPPNSEATGEVVLTPGENGTWTVEFVAISGQPPALGSQAVVLGAGDCLTFRAGPGRTQEPLSCQIDGARGEVIGGPQTADNITWWQIKDLGWASGEFLQKAP